MGIVSITEHDSLSYSTGIRPDGGAKQGWGVGGHCLSLCWHWEWTGAGLDTQLFLAAPHQTLRRPIKVHVMDECFCICVNICLARVPVWVAQECSCLITNIRA